MITLWIIYSNAKRIQLKFTIHDVVRLDDLTHYKSNSISNNNNINNNNNNSSSSNLISMSGNSSLLLSNRIRGKPTEYVV
jgi:hypothetical protein